MTTVKTVSEMFLGLAFFACTNTIQLFTSLIIEATQSIAEKLVFCNPAIISLAREK